MCLQGQFIVLYEDRIASTFLPKTFLVILLGFSLVEVLGIQILLFTYIFPQG